eukprot:Nitzschia sp. Nitz4//scaffold85_size83877//42020//42966//NITZ4_005230-RA/size83877-augustus-gene-0.161-mRNA-1//-1//CDS//3329559140//829//frame0
MSLSLLSRSLLSKRGGQYSLSAFARSFSSQSKDDLVLLDLNEETAIGTLTLNRKPANSLSLELLTSISDAVQTAEANPSIKALIVTSSSDKIFSAGVDIHEMYEPDTERFYNFWRAFQDMYLNIYGSRLACVAAMTGHAPAGGCLLALSCDYRVMTNGKARMGLNESMLGLKVPLWMGDLYIDTIGHRQAELALEMGRLFDVDSALKVGLVDEVVEQDQLISTATEMAMKMIKLPSSGFAGNKSFARSRQMQRLLDTREEDYKDFWEFTISDQVQKALGSYLEQLAKKKKQI